MVGFHVFDAAYLHSFISHHSHMDTLWSQTDYSFPGEISVSLPALVVCAVWSSWKKFLSNFLPSKFYSCFSFSMTFYHFFDAIPAPLPTHMHTLYLCHIELKASFCVLLENSVNISILAFTLLGVMDWMFVPPSKFIGWNLISNMMRFGDGISGR